MATAPVNCLVCLNFSQNVPSNNGKKEPNEDMAKDCITVNKQLTVIFLLRKLLEIPIDVCSQFLQVYGNPCLWISCCVHCSRLVTKGRQIFDKISLLQDQLEKVQLELKSSIAQSVQAQRDSLTSAEPQSGATDFVRLYIKNGEKELIKKASAVQTIADCHQKNSQLFQSYSTPVEIFKVEPVYNNVGVASSLKPMLKNRSDVSSEDKVDYVINNDSKDKITKKVSESLEILSDEEQQECKICGKIFPSLIALHFHDKWAHTMDKPFSCSVCGEKFKLSSDLMQHRETHEGEASEESAIYQIPILPLGQGSFVNGISVTVVDPLEAGNETRPFLCTICGQSYKHNNTLTEHKRTHTGEMPYKCNLCGMHFMRNKTLKRHLVKHTKTDSKLVPCADNTNAIEERLCKCHICGKGFLHSRTLRRHLITHEISRMETVSYIQHAPEDHNQFVEEPVTYGTEVSAISFEHSVSRLVNPPPVEILDMEGFQNDLYQCNVCWQIFDNSDALQSHLSVHSEDTFECRVCGTIFMQYSDLKSHMVQHKQNTQDSPARFDCDICGKSYAQRKSLKVHRMSHTMWKPYECHICGAGYTQSHNLRKHIKNVHEKATNQDLIVP